MKYTYKTKPYPHQHKALRKIVKSLRARHAAALFMPMRSGKTKVAIDAAGYLHLKYGIKRVLVVAPLSVLGVWRKQIAIHQSEDVKLRWVLVNYEMVYDRKMYEDGTWEPIPRKSLYRYDPELIIVDESHKIGNPTSVQSKELYKLQRDQPTKPFRIIQTGTPFHRKPLMVFGQFKFLDDTVFGTAFGKFKSKYAVTGGYGGFKILRYKNQSSLLKRISRFSFLMKTLPFVPPQHEVVPYQLEESEPIYQQMADESIAMLTNGGVIEAKIALVRALRLSQICGGRLKDADGEMQRVGREKQRAFKGLVEQFDENEVDKFVVFARFVPELKDIVEVCKDAGYKVYLMYGATPGPVREQRIAEFDETEDRAVFVSQVSTGSMGIDLSAAAVEVFYSLPQSLVDYDQDCARVKKWNDKRTLTYYYMVGDGTVEEVNLSALRANLDLIEVLMRDPLLLYYEGRG
jgi:superfamily II DNA or RNA helicase